MTRIVRRWVRLDRFFSATDCSQIGYRRFDSNSLRAGADDRASDKPKPKLEKVRGRSLTTKEAKHTKTIRARDFRVVRFFRGQLSFPPHRRISRSRSRPGLRFDTLGYAVGGGHSFAAAGR